MDGVSRVWLPALPIHTISNHMVTLTDLACPAPDLPRSASRIIVINRCQRRFFPRRLYVDSFLGVRVAGEVRNSDSF